MYGCSPTKHLEPGQVFLKKNKVAINKRTVDTDILLPYIKQRTNKKTLWFFNVKMRQYTMIDAEKLQAKEEKRKRKHQLKNERRLAKGKDTLTYKPSLKYKIKKSGEAPIAFDSSMVPPTIHQFEKELFNQGFFDNEVYTEYKYKKDSSKVVVVYKANEGPRYLISKIGIVLEDTSLTSSVQLANKQSKLFAGMPYSTRKLDEERERFTTEMRNQGYYFFTQEYVSFEVDSSLVGNNVYVKIHITNPDSLSTYNTHKKYRIGEITLNPSFNAKYRDDYTDSIHFEDITFINLSRLHYNPHMFSEKLFFAKGDYYSQENQSRTYTRLSGLNNFKYINIAHTPSVTDSLTLDCQITMSRMDPQSIGVEVEGTNTSGNLGVSGYLSYQHRNLFNNAELFRIRIKGGIEAQQSAQAQENSDGIFNTIEYGFETALAFQDLIIPRAWRDNILRKFNKPKTVINAVYNFQQRPDFIRNLSNASLGYAFTKKDKNVNEFYINPIDISFIRIHKFQHFQDRLDELNNPLLNATYDNQIIVGMRFMETWTNKKTTSQPNFKLNRMQIETAGNVLSLFDQLTGKEKINDEYYTIDSIRYAQFVKVQNDFQYNNRIARGQSMAYRFLVGVGIPFGNSEVLPYDRSFYGGGANDMRGWRARQLGPGSMADSLKLGVDQVADIKLQISAEYRFNIIRAMEGALFADLGNIWLLREDPNRPNAEFNIERFGEEIALSTGAGLRFNFGFLLVRLDWGFKIIDPSLPKGQRFVADRGEYLNNYKSYSGGRSYEYSVFNLGIGYPF